jgi:hypothetical protein
MKPYQAIGYMLLNTSAISAIVGTRVDHGRRPKGKDVPCINYYELGGTSRFNGVESANYSINCRADSASGARDLARLVMDLFIGDSSTGTYGTQNGFEISRASLVNDNGLISEPGDKIFNAPIDIKIVYPSTAVS